MQQLTYKQQAWLDHVNQASSQNISMSAYAKKNNLSIKAFYCARTMLIKIGCLPPKESTQLISVESINTVPPTQTSSCRVTLINGVMLDFSKVDLSLLIDKVSQL